MSPAQYHMSEKEFKLSWSCELHLHCGEDLTPGVTAPSKTRNKDELTL